MFIHLLFKPLSSSRRLSSCHFRSCRKRETLFSVVGVLNTWSRAIIVFGWNETLNKPLQIRIRTYKRTRAKQKIFAKHEYIDLAIGQRAKNVDQRLQISLPLAQC